MTRMFSFKLMAGVAVVFLTAACTVDTFGPENEGGELTEDGDDDVVGSISSPIMKGLPGAVNGAGDYCAGGVACTAGEGDCDSTNDCATGLRCGANIGPRFGFTRTTDVCVPVHCTNRRLDGDETQPDCGGSCGSMCEPHQCPLAPHPDKCVAGACICLAGQGDCDAHADCAPGLSCVANSGPKYGMPSTYDVCAPSHCGNRIQDGNETSVDCGGSCGTEGPCVGQSSLACRNLTGITFRWVATACQNLVPLTFTINGTTALSAAQSYGCSCSSSIRSETVNSTELLNLIVPGNNTVAVQAQNAQLGFAWATMTLQFQGGSTRVVVLDDVNGGSTSPEQANVCTAGYLFSRRSPVQTVSLSADTCG